MTLSTPNKPNSLLKVFNAFGPEYVSLFGKKMPQLHAKAFRDIDNCRTPTYGILENTCTECGEYDHTYGACRNRACPRCNSLKNIEWIQSLCAKFPNINYYHLVFTVPEELREPARSNQNLFYNLLFNSVNETLRSFSSCSEWMEGKSGYMCILHTWDSKINIHPHVHVLFMGGYISSEGDWIPLSKSKVFPNEAMSVKFKSIMMKRLREQLPEAIDKDIWKTKWIVYSKKVEAGDNHAIEYLGSYVKRTAIASSRITATDDTTVTFKYRHHVDRHTTEMRDMSVSGIEFLRRYLQHVLPPGFVKVRYYGLMHSSNAKVLKDLIVSNGSVSPSAKYAEKQEKKCSTCKVAVIITMIALPMYRPKVKELGEKTRGKFYIRNRSEGSVVTFNHQLCQTRPP